MANKTEQQTEIDGLREEVRRLRHERDAYQKEADALRAGKTEARTIAESAEMLAAERDSLKADLVNLAAHAGDLKTVIDSYEANLSPPPDVMRRVNARRYGTQLQNGVPPQAPKSSVLG